VKSLKTDRDLRAVGCYTYKMQSVDVDQVLRDLQVVELPGSKPQALG